jgi:hypothetical protein
MPLGGNVRLSARRRSMASPPLASESRFHIPVEYSRAHARLNRTLRFHAQSNPFGGPMSASKKLAIALFAAVAALVGCRPSAPVEPASGPADAAPAAATAPAPPVATPQPAAKPAPEPVAQTPAAAAASASKPAPVAVGGDNTVNDAIDENLGDHTKYETVIHGFQAAVAKGDKQAVAELVHYPFGATIRGKNHIFKTPAEFVAGYDEIVTPDIASVIVAQKYPDLFVNYKGVMFGSGQAWINGICKDNACKQFDVKVVTIQPGP